jgi:PKHD-type hydroxylase
MRNYRKSYLWFITDLPEEIIDLIERDLSNLDSSFQPSTVGDQVLDNRKRSSKNTWVPTTHWIGGFIWHYIERANRENFRYDISCIDSETMQYTCYNEGDFYNWHVDDNEKRLTEFIDQDI